MRKLTSSQFFEICSKLVLDKTTNSNKQNYYEFIDEICDKSLEKFKFKASNINDALFIAKYMLLFTDYELSESDNFFNFLFMYVLEDDYQPGDENFEFFDLKIIENNLKEDSITVQDLTDEQLSKMIEEIIDNYNTEFLVRKSPKYKIKDYNKLIDKFAKKFTAKIT